jgi:hypothetical protein
MDWKLHLIIPFVAYALIVTVFSFSLEFGIASLIILFFSTLLPDLDHPKSFIRYIVVSTLFFIVMVFVILAIQADIMTRLLIIIMAFVLFYGGHKKLPVHHRGEKSLHRWRYAFIFTGAFLLISVMAGIGLLLSVFFLLGYSVHLLLDRIRIL